MTATTPANATAPASSHEVLAEPAAVAALTRLAAALRHGHPGVRRLADRGGVHPDELTGVLDADAMAAALATRVLVCIDDDDWAVAPDAAPPDHRLALGLALDESSGVTVVTPLTRSHDDIAYTGPDTRWVWSLAWRHGPREGDVAVDLGCGAGFLTSILRSRFRRVIGTDLTVSSTATTALTLATTPVRGRVAGAVRTDIGAGLRSGVADLVVANPPYIPGSNRVWAEGGDDGMALPRRFAHEAVRLLAPGGVGIVVALDSTWADGSRPLRDLADELRLHAEVEVVVGDPATEGLGANAYPTLVSKLDALVDAMPGALVIRR